MKNTLSRSILFQCIAVVSFILLSVIINTGQATGNTYQQLEGAWQLQSTEYTAEDGSLTRISPNHRQIEKTFNQGRLTLTTTINGVVTQQKHGLYTLQQQYIHQVFKEKRPNPPTVIRSTYAIEQKKGHYILTINGISEQKKHHEIWLKI